MTTAEINTHHELAMWNAGQAKALRLESDARLKRAFDHERKAAEAIEPLPENEPSRSVMLRSAAQLALECNELTEAKRIAGMVICGPHSPKEIVEEAEEIFEVAKERMNASIF